MMRWPRSWLVATLVVWMACVACVCAHDDEDHQVRCWRWASGFRSANNPGFYGELGVPATDQAPGGRRNAATWTDPDGTTLWLFGGKGLDQNNGTGEGRLNDLWSFNTANHAWTWVSGSSQVGSSGTYVDQGVASAAAVPAARSGAVAWRVGSLLWLWGGRAANDAASGDIRALNDLWHFNVTSGLWTWVSGDATGTYGNVHQPDARWGAVGWSTQNGFLYLAHGATLSIDDGSQTFVSDVWSYNIQSATWTLIRGNNTVYNEASVVAVAGGHPGARDDSVVWTDAGGQVWLYGGYGKSPQGNVGPLNGLWTSTNAGLEWTLLGDSEVVNADPVYQDQPSSQALLGSRQDATAWSVDGELYLFGGSTGAAASAYKNDVFSFDTAANVWQWEAGPSLDNHATTEDYMGARRSASTWLDAGGHVWLFGGFGSDINGAQGYLNDMWTNDRASGCNLDDGGSSTRTAAIVVTVILIGIIIVSVIVAVKYIRKDTPLTASLSDMVEFDLEDP